jgi:hypothetical protein
MTDEELIGYALDLLDPDDRAAVEVHLAAHPEAAARLDQLRRDFAALDADREIDPPRGLAVRTVARLAEYLVAHEPRISASAPTDPEIPLADLTRPGPAGPAVRRGRTGPPPADRPEVRTFGGRFRAELFVAAGIALVAFGLVVSAVGRARHQSQVMACQNNLRVLYQGLTGYADSREGRFPQVGTPPHPTAGAFVAALAESGQVPYDFRPLCPAGPPARDGGSFEPVGYTYTLGYRAPTGELCGLRRSDAPAADNDLLPISADYPAAGIVPAGGPVSPHGRVMVTLFVGGHVRPTTTALVGPNGDDIFRNWHGQVGAGLDRRDAVLGRPGDRP